MPLLSRRERNFAPRLGTPAPSKTPQSPSVLGPILNRRATQSSGSVRSPAEDVHLMVELVGFEPTTSCVQGRRSRPAELQPHHKMHVPSNSLSRCVSGTGLRPHNVLHIRPRDRYWLKPSWFKSEQKHYRSYPLCDLPVMPLGFFHRIHPDTYDEQYAQCHRSDSYRPGV